MKLESTYHDIISVENLLLAWKEFLKGKRNKKDVQEFQFKLMDNIFDLHNDLKNKTYKHSIYEAFNIFDPKPRNIHKAKVKDRLLHHAIYRILYPYFDKRFVVDSYSCRLNKGTHRAIDRFRIFTQRVSQNNTKNVWVLKCDIRKFFASIDHKVLIEILNKHICDKDILLLLQNIIESFHSTHDGIGLPLGNLTSQLLVNIYMNEFDQHVKHTLKIGHYIRYADDFVLMSPDKTYLENILIQVRIFLLNELKLDLHPDKVFIKTLASGVDFLGWVHFPCHRVLRTATKKRIMRKISEKQNQNTIVSYVGLLQHGNAKKIMHSITGWYPD